MNLFSSLMNTCISLSDLTKDINEHVEASFGECKWCGFCYRDENLDGKIGKKYSRLPFCSKKCEAEALEFFGKQKASRGSPKSGGRSCDVCGMEITKKDDKFCSNCGCRLQKEGWKCSCDPSRELYEDYCPTCGKRLSASRGYYL
jgi:hypothetical protein